ncbi:MAG: Flp pilus assembly complex ATPase component TadA [Candidatus Magnetoovum sp. WYHC-5]|nr:Flp pilus assembly complex ATPase component TadA [Candidatus Magnetoovum sp. WYHC-5]
MQIKARRRIGELLVANGVIAKAQLDFALSQQGTMLKKGESHVLGSILVEHNILTSKQLLTFVNKYNIRLPLGEVLLMEKKITRTELAKALDLQKEYESENKDVRLGTILADELHLINYDTLLRCIAKQYNITRIKPDLSEVDPEYFFSFDKEKIKELMIIPYRKYFTEQNELTCQVIVCESAVNRIRIYKKDIMEKTKAIFIDTDEKKKNMQLSIDFAVASYEEIRDFIIYAYENREAISFSQKIKIESIAEDEIIKIGKKYYSANINMNIFMQILAKAIEMRASDVHIEPLSDRLRVRFRIDGVLIPQSDLPKTLNNYFVRGLKNFFRFKDSYVKNIVVDERKRVYYEDKNIELDIRLSIIPTNYGNKMVIRLLIQQETVPTFEKLGFWKNLKTKYELVCTMSSGMVIVTGPTGAGKTTTLYSTLDYLNDDKINIMTLEDPPEYLINGVNQVRVGSDDKSREISYLQGLKSIFRQDPDIIMFGEMRDYESATVALTAGLTGHLLFTTLHTADAASCITRLMDMGIRPFLLSSTLVSILAQRLVRRICPQCKEEYTPDHNELEFFSLFIKNFEKDTKAIKFYRGAGCDNCFSTGYKERFAIHELLCINDQIRKTMLAGGIAKDAELIARQHGMTSLVEDGFLKVIKGYTTLSEILRVAKTLETPKNKRTIEEIAYLLEGPISRETILASIYTS